MTEALQGRPGHELAGLAVGVALLAAGEGSRMGGVPKCLIRMGGQPLIRRAVSALQEAGAARIVVVTGHYAEAIETELAALDAGAVEVVRNPAPERGQQSSVRLGLQALAAHPLDVVLVALADQPLVGADDLRELVAAWAARPAGCRVVYPEVDAQRGNPVLIEAALAAEVLAARASSGAGGQGGQGGLRGWIDAHPEAVHRYETANRHFITDLDTPQDLQHLATATGLAVDLPAG